VQLSDVDYSPVSLSFPKIESMSLKTSLAPFFFFGLMTVSTLCSEAQVITTAVKPNPHINYNRLTRIDDVVNDYIKKNWIAGAVTLIIKDGQVIQHKSYGYDDIDAKKPLDKNAIFRIASQTKALASVGIMTLYEKGQLLLTDPVSKYIPEFANATVLDKFNAADTTYTTVPAKRLITIKDLLTHTSGIDYAVIGTKEMTAIYAKSGIPSGIGELHANLADKMKALGKLPLAAQPGTRFLYGLNVDVLGYIIEKISGLSLDAYLAKELFVPLGMKDTYFNVPASKANRLTTLYTEDSAHHLIKQQKDVRGISPDYPLHETHYFSGGAGASSTAYDYAIFLQMLLNGGSYNGVQILSPRTVEMMVQNQTGDINVGNDKFGLGFQITTEKGATESAKSIGSFAWGGYFGTTYWADPKEKLVCLIMTQQAPNSHGDLGKKFEPLVYGLLK